MTKPLAYKCLYCRFRRNSLEGSCKTVGGVQDGFFILPCENFQEIDVQIFPGKQMEVIDWDLKNWKL